MTEVIAVESTPYSPGASSSSALRTALIVAGLLACYLALGISAACRKSQTGDEGCLSFPGIYVPVKRGLRARVRAVDVDGKAFEMSGEALFARALQHENDHLIGRLLIDQCGPVKREIIKRKLRKEAQAEADSEAADA